jgi:hypothetical protein
MRVPTWKTPRRGTLSMADRLVDGRRDKLLVKMNLPLLTGS